MNRQVKVKRRTLRTIEHSLMVHARVLEAYINFELIYKTDHILLVLAIKDLINEDVKPATSFKPTMVMKHSASHLHTLFCPYVVRKTTAHVGTKALNMRHQWQKFFVVSSLEFHNIKKDILCTYHTQGRQYLHTVLFLMGLF